MALDRVSMSSVDGAAQPGRAAPTKIIGSNNVPLAPPSRLRSVNGKHAPFVRPRCGFDSCRRLSANARSSAERALLCDGRGRWFDSSRAYQFADVAQTEEHRSATPARPVRSGSSALEGAWCNGKHGELQPRWSGFDPWRACFTKTVAGRSGRLSVQGQPCRHACASRESCSSAAVRMRRRRCTSAFPDVLAAHAGSVRVKHRLRPLGVAMASRDVYDPYKD